MEVYICICKLIYKCMYIYSCAYVYTYMSSYIYMYIHIYRYTHIPIHINMHARVNIYCTCIYKYIHVCLRVCTIYICRSMVALARTFFRYYIHKCWQICKHICIHIYVLNAGYRTVFGVRKSNDFSGSKLHRVKSHEIASNIGVNLVIM